MALKRLWLCLCAAALLLLFSLVCQAETAAPASDEDKPLKFSRELSGTYIGYGEYVTITYTVRNEGSVPLKNVVVVDALAGQQVGSVDLLSPGEKRTFSARVAVTQECVSSPYATYELDGNMDMVTREPETIRLADVQFTTLLEADKTNVAPGDVVTLRITLQNTGNVTISRLRLTDSALGDLGILLSELRAGQEYTVTKTVQIKTTTTFHFEVSGFNATGGEVSYYSNELTIFATPVASDVRLSLAASVNVTELDAPGEVTFYLFLNNEGTLELRNVRLYEQERGDVRTLLFVPVGQTPAVTQTYYVETTGAYCFSAEFTDSAGDTLTVTGDPILITVAGTRDPGATLPPEVPELQGASYRLGESNGLFQRLMLYTSFLLLALAAIFFYSARVRARRERRLRRRTRRRRNQSKSGRKRA